MTLGDRMRSMSDEELAWYLAGLMAKQRNSILQALKEKGLAKDISVIEMPMMVTAALLKMIKSEIGEGHHG